LDLSIGFLNRVAKTAFLIIQIVLSACLVGLILIQSKGSGLGSPLWGDISIYSTRRGVEKIIFYITIGVAVLFLFSSIAQLLSR